MIEIVDVSKVYKEGPLLRPHTAIENLNLKVESGKTFGFLGPNGSGKTTTIKLLTGLLHPTRGKVRVWGQNPSNYKNRIRMGFSPEQPFFYDYLTGAELLKYYGGLSGLGEKQVFAGLSEIGAILKFEEAWLSQKLKSYSKGMLQKVSILQATLHKPELLILDEPMSGLDPLARGEVGALIKYFRELGSTVFYSSHVLSDVEDLCDEVGVIIKGNLEVRGSLSELLEGGKSLHQVFTSAIESSSSKNHHD